MISIDEGYSTSRPRTATVSLYCPAASAANRKLPSGPVNVSALVPLPVSRMMACAIGEFEASLRVPCQATGAAAGWACDEMEKTRNAVNANRLRQQDLPERCTAVLSWRFAMPDLRGSGTRTRTLFRPFPQLSGSMVP